MTQNAPDYSIIIPAYNEADCLPVTLAHLARAMDSVDLDGEIIVVDNNSDDNTRACALEAGAIVVHEPVNQISRARNTGAGHARGKYLIFLDADTLLDRELLQRALKNLTSNRHIGGGALVAGDRIAPKAAQRAMNGWNWLSQRFGLAAGCFIYSRADAFRLIGGFSERVYASEEVWLSRALKKEARRQQLLFTIIEEPKIRTSLRKLDWYSRRQLCWHTMVVFFPFALRSKTLCAFWYRRPALRRVRSDE